MSLIPGMVSLLLGGGVALLCAVLMLLAASAALSAGLISQSCQSQLVIGVVLFSAFFGGIVGKRGWEHKKLIAGVLSGVVFFLMLAVIGLLGYSGYNLMQYGIGNLISSVCGGAMAGMLNGKQGRRGKRRNRK